jgi:hypothetical protein
LRAGGFPDENVNDIVAIERAASTHEILRTEILLRWGEAKLLRLQVDPITGEGARRFTNVLLGVVADSDGEEFDSFHFCDGDGVSTMN